MFAIFTVFASATVLVQQHEERSFVNFMRQTGVMYTGEEYRFRLGIYVTNARLVQEHNKKGLSYRVGLNEFSCWTPAELRSLNGAIQTPTGSESRPGKVREVGAAPDAIDWRDHNVVIEVKSQGNCGACYAFSACAAQESQWALVKGNLWSLSESNIVDCATNCHGCAGGWPADAYQYIIDNQGGCFNRDVFYPYRPVVNTCKYEPARIYTNITGWITVEKGNEEDLKEKVGTLGPASICIDSSSWSFIYYESGIFDNAECSSTYLVHAVCCVGYGTEEGSGIQYWLIKNSWGVNWGEAGYARMIRNAGNQCGEASVAIIPTVE